MENVIIEQMVIPEDMEGKGYVHYTSWQETYCGLVDDRYLSRMSVEKCIAIAKSWPDRTLVAKVDGKVVGKVVGFACYWKNNDSSLIHTGEIYAIYVLKQYQCQQIGYRLRKEALMKLKEYDWIVLWVLKENQKAISFYQRLGFSLDGVEQEIMLGTPNMEVRMQCNHYDSIEEGDII